MSVKVCFLHIIVLWQNLKQWDVTIKVQGYEQKDNSAKPTKTDYERFL